jgi:hypothetical protein
MTVNKIGQRNTENRGTHKEKKRKNRLENNSVRVHHTDWFLTTQPSHRRTKLKYNDVHRPLHIVTSCMQRNIITQHLSVFYNYKLL